MRCFDEQSEKGHPQDDRIAIAQPSGSPRNPGSFGWDVENNPSCDGEVIRVIRY
jgi:hypothetical protein